MNKKKLLPSASVHHATYIYDKHIHEVIPSLTAKERDVLHVIYENMKHIDKFLDNLYREFIEFSYSVQLYDPFQAYAGMCQDLIEVYHLTQNLIEEYLQGKPREISWNEGLSRANDDLPPKN